MSDLECLRVVNRDFQFVIEPKYEKLTPAPRYESSSLDSPGDWFAYCPSFYIAVEKEGAQQKLISVKNEILLKLPENHFFNHLESSANCVAMCILDGTAKLFT